jgi:hypothetical protein
MAMCGLLGVGGCRQQFESPTYPFQHEDTEEAQRPLISDEELQMILHDPDADLCVAKPLDMDAPPEILREPTWEQNAEIAKALYERGQRAQAEGDLACALELMEEAYYRVPEKHGFALIVGELAAAVGDCVKACVFLEHFVDYGDPERNPDKYQRAKALLDTPELRNCVRPESVSDAEPSPQSETKRQRRERERAEHDTERKQTRHE